MREGARAKDFELAIQWLEDAGLIIPSYRITKPDIPLIAYMEMNSFKMFTFVKCFLIKTWGVIKKESESLILTGLNIPRNYFDEMEDYYNSDTGSRAYVGRNANRIKNASVTIEGIEYCLDKNNLHSGFDRSHCKIYDANYGKNKGGYYVEFSRTSPPLEQGFPGNLNQKIRYTLTEQNELIIDYKMVGEKQL